MSTGSLSCALPLPTNYRPQDILSFHARDTLVVSESVEASQSGRVPEFRRLALGKGLLRFSGKSRLCALHV